MEVLQGRFSHSPIVLGTLLQDLEFWAAEVVQRWSWRPSQERVVHFLQAPKVLPVFPSLNKELVV